MLTDIDEFKSEIQLYFKARKVDEVGKIVAGDIVKSGGERSSFEIVEINNNKIRIKPINGEGIRTIRYDYLAIVVEKFEPCAHGEMVTFVTNILGIKGINVVGKGIGRTYLYGMAREYLQRKQANIPTQQPSPNVQRTLEDVQCEFEKDVEEAKKRSSEERKARLEKAPKKPESSTVTTKAFKRNADVVVAVLERAKGECERKNEGCKNPVPFKRNNGSTFLEVHHIIRLADGGDDTVENAIALCPNCHRELHFGKIN